MTCIKDVFSTCAENIDAAAHIGAIVALTHGRKYVAIWGENSDQVWIMNMSDSSATPSIHNLPAALMSLWVEAQADDDLAKLMIGYLLDHAPIKGWVNAYGVAVLHDE